MQLGFLLHDHILKGKYRSIFIYPINLKIYISDKHELNNIRKWRTAMLLSLVGVLTTFVFMIVTQESL
jgi:hypothetical protein